MTTSYPGAIDSYTTKVNGVDVPDAVSYTDGIIDEAFIARRVYTDDERSWFWNGGAGRRYTDLITPQGVTGVFLSDYGVI